MTAELPVPVPGQLGLLPTCSGASHSLQVCLNLSALRCVTLTQHLIKLLFEKRRPQLTRGLLHYVKCKDVGSYSHCICPLKYKLWEKVAGESGLATI